MSVSNEVVPSTTWAKLCSWGTCYLQVVCPSNISLLGTKGAFSFLGGGGMSHFLNASFVVVVPSNLVGAGMVTGRFADICLQKPTLKQKAMIALLHV